MYTLSRFVSQDGGREGERERERERIHDQYQAGDSCDLPTIGIFIGFMQETNTIYYTIV